jgi:predicted Fe-S protein YdhL (DUF1289 family)
LHLLEILPSEEPPSVVPASATAPVRIVCTGCGRTPAIEAIAWSDAQRQHVHLAHRNRTNEGILRVCGGQVVREEDEWRALLQPGTVRLCRASNHRGLPHRVRLGRPANARNESWTGTALCGAPVRYWIPERDEKGARRTCPACADSAGGDPPRP